MNTSKKKFVNTETHKKSEWSIAKSGITSMNGKMPTVKKWICDGYANKFDLFSDGNSD